MSDQKLLPMLEQHVRVNMGLRGNNGRSRLGPWQQGTGRMSVDASRLMPQSANLSLQARWDSLWLAPQPSGPIVATR